MSIRYYRGRYELKLYDPGIKRLRYIGRYPTEDAAREAQKIHQAPIDGVHVRRCPGCRKRFRPEDQWQLRCSERCENNVKRRVRRAEQRRTNVHWTYICADANGEVIYVGVTSTGLRRHREHGRDSMWWPEVATIKVEHYPTREEALAAETANILRLRPRFNVLLNPDVEDEAA